MKPPKLFDPVRNMIRTKHYSIRTEEAYYLQKAQTVACGFYKR